VAGTVTKLRELSKSLAIYGLGDVAVQIINFLLLPLYVLYLSDADYGIIALLAAVEAPAKLFFRWGIDGAFMRFWYDCKGETERQRLASTLFFFLLAVNGVLLVASVAAAPFLSERLLETPGYTLALQLVLLNTFAIGFTFIPFHVLRMQNKPGEFSALTLARSLSTLLLRLALIVGFGYGVMGIVIADVVVTGLLMVVLLRWFAPLIRPVFSMAVLRRSLAFGLPRVPHGFALQVMAVADRVILKNFRSMDDVGVYSIGVSFGLIPKIALGAFEAAWAPFYYATSREPGAQRVFTTVATYGIAVLALMTAGLSAIAADLLDVMTRGRFVEAAPVVAWTAIGVFFYGIYLLTSIGLNITSQTRYYPVSTFAGALVNVVLNLLLIPGYGILGAAWANGASYAVQCGIAYHFSQRFYPIPYEGGRLARAVGAAGLGYLAAGLLPAMSSLAGVFARGTTVVVVMAAVLWITGFFNTGELRWLNALRQARRRDPVTRSADATEMGGEIVSVDVPDDLVDTRPKGPDR
jgi:O-antigen/teichoic acid export membrane protein